MRALMRIVLIGMAIVLLAGCDPDRKRKCEWYLQPEPRHRELVAKGWVSLCAKNYTTMKQKCYIQTPLAFAEKVHAKPFRYVDLKLDDKSFPKKVKSVTFCPSR